MRRSSVEGDAGYAPWHHERAMGCYHRVFLDGIEQAKVTTADESDGFVVRAVLDDEGHMQTNPYDPEIVWEERVEGEVKIAIEFPAS